MGCSTFIIMAVVVVSLSYRLSGFVAFILFVSFDRVWLAFVVVLGNVVWLTLCLVAQHR